MATYAIGDLQGCYDSLQRLLEHISFGASQDRVWLAGDLVNRGPRSLAALRWARDHDSSVVAVLGNHDLHLLAISAGWVTPRPNDTLDELLAAPDRDELVDWLRHRPLVHEESGQLLVHAGLLPQWTVAEATAAARLVESALRAPDWKVHLADWYGPARRARAARDGDSAPSSARTWSDTKSETERTELAAAILTRIRTCHDDGAMCTSFSGPPMEAPPGCVPWYLAPQRRNVATRVVFGHWAALGLSQGPSWLCVDTGCAWGEQLTAVRLEDDAVFQVQAVEPPAPGSKPR